LYGISPLALVATYILLSIFSPLFGLFALLLSTAMEKPVRGVGFSGFLMLYGLVAISVVAADGPFPALAAISIAPAVLQLHGAFSQFDLPEVVPLIFGVPANLFVLTPAILASMAAWLFVMVRRNLKKDVEEISLLSRWQAIGLCVYLNFLFYAFLDSSKFKFLDPPKTGSFEVVDGGPEFIAHFVMVCMLLLNGLILFAGSTVASVTPREPLKIWWRRFKAGQASYLSENGLPWPWLVLAGLIAYAMFFLYAMTFSSRVPLQRWELGWTATQLLFLVVFAVRDVLFLQWCKLTRMKNAVSKGAGLLMLHYIAVVVIILVVHSATERFDGFLLSFLTPFAPTDPDTYVVLSVAGIALQVAVCVLLVTAITRRLDRPVTAPVVAD
jgi:hypothetical protein